MVEGKRGNNRAKVSQVSKCHGTRNAGRVAKNGSKKWPPEWADLPDPETLEALSRGEIEPAPRPDIAESFPGVRELRRARATQAKQGIEA